MAVSSHDLTFNVFEVLTGVGCFCAWINILSFLDQTSESFIVVNTFKRSYNVLLLYMLGLFPIYLGYSHLGMTLFWQSGYFLDLLGSMMILFAMLNGDSIDFFFSTMLPINYIFAQIYFYSFVVLFICVVQNIFISIINNAFESFKTRPVKATGDVSDEEEEKHEEPSESSLILRRPGRRNTRNMLDSTFHAEMKSQKIFQHLITHNISLPLGDKAQEIEENTDVIIAEMEALDSQITKLMFDIRDKALEEPKDDQAVIRFKEIIQVELPSIFEEILKDLS